MENEGQESTFDIIPLQEEMQAEVSGPDLSGLSPEEIKMGQDSGVIAKNEEDKKKESQKEESQKEEPKAKEDNKKEPLSEEEQIKAYNSNEKGLYFSAKRSKRRAQEAERKEELSRIKLAAKTQEIEELKRQLKESGVIDDDPEKVLTQADLENHDKVKELERKEKELESDEKAHQAEIIKGRLNDQESEARAKDSQFDTVCELASEIMAQDKSGIYAMKMQSIAADVNGYVPDFIYQVAKLNPKYGETVKSTPQLEGKKRKNVERMVANSQKRNSSAAVNGGGVEARRVSESDLTPQDVANFSPNQYAKLKPATRKRLLFESCS